MTNQDVLSHTYQHPHHVECLGQTLSLFVITDHFEVLHSSGLDESVLEDPAGAGGGGVRGEVV